MTKKKYSLKLNHLLQEGGIAKAERDGFSSAEVHKVLYREAGDATNQEREKIVKDFFRRR
jgi:hypothetical protein